jgi:GST-like protein
MRVAIALEESGLPYEVVPIDLNREEQRSPEFLALNPMGRVPVLVDDADSARPFALTQSNAILFYVAERAPGRLFPEKDPISRALTYERFFFFLTDVIAPSHAAFQLRRSDQQHASSVLDQRSISALSTTERFLNEGPFMAGEHFSVADIAAYTITLATRRHLDWVRLPQLTQWFDRIGKRPSVGQGLRAFDI